MQYLVARLDVTSVIFQIVGTRKYTIQHDQVDTKHVFLDKRA